jgi:hypothetical protein
MNAQPSLAVVPVTVLNDHKRENSRQEVPFHPEYKGNVHFQNAFNGQLPATDYPKVTVCFPSPVHLSLPSSQFFVLVLYCHVLHIHRCCGGMGVPMLETC